jgi:excinuclease ABC subunit C
LFEKKAEKDQPLKELKQTLGLKNIPRRIEGFDISNTGGQDSVGSMSVFVNAKPLKSDYRKYKIKSISRPDDVGSIQEIIYRRYARVSKNMGHKPDLILVDGGKGQLNAAEKALKELNLIKLPLLALAKKEELIYCQKYPHGLSLDKTSPGLRLLQNIRDEAHRFALDFHRKRREKKSTASELDNIPGIGPKRKAALLSHYESIDEIKKAPLEELKKLIGARAAQALLQDLK